MQIGSQGNLACFILWAKVRTHQCLCPLSELIRINMKFLEKCSKMFKYFNSKSSGVVENVSKYGFL